MKKIPLCCTAIALVLAYALTCFAASTLTISSSGGGAFVLQGTGIESAAAFEITVAYDSSSLANPRVTQGALVSGALMAVNSNMPGTIRIAMVTTNPVSGSGPIANFAFDLRGSSSGKITSLNAKLANINGQQLPVVAQVIAPPEQPASGGTGQQGQTTPAGSATGSSGSGSDNQQGAQIILNPGIIMVPGAVPPQERTTPITSEHEKEQPSTEKTAGQEQITLARKTEPHPDKTPEARVRKVHALTSVLDRFREFKGTMSMAKYLSFFEQDTLLGFRQEPLVALTDGKSRVRVTFISVPGERNLSEAALAGARLISLARDPDYSNTWIADIQPAKGEFSASLSIPQGKIIMLYPVTVAPGVNIDLDKSGSITKADFDLFLNDRGSPGSPRFDLNGDGKRDYIDDYIFTANYIAVRGPH